MHSWLRIIQKSLAPPFVLFIFLLIAWHLGTKFFAIPHYIFPSPQAVYVATVNHFPEIIQASLLTAAAALSGFLLSFFIGLGAAFLFSEFSLLRRSCYPYAIFFQTVPIVAIVPLIITWFDVGFQSIVIIAFIISIFPIITNGTVGLSEVDTNLYSLFTLYSASRWQILCKLKIPHAIPYLVAGARISVGLSIIGAIVGEFYAGYGTSHYGLGYLILLAAHQIKTAYLFALILASTLLGLIFFGAANGVGNFLLRYRKAEASSFRKGKS